jgi:hypothetical protein
VLLRDLLERQAAGIVRGLPVVGDTEIGIAALPYGFGHIVQRIHTIGKVRVRVKDATNIFILHQSWKPTLKSAIDFVPAFAELRLDKWQTERRCRSALRSRRQPRDGRAASPLRRIQELFLRRVSAEHRDAPAIPSRAAR